VSETESGDQKNVLIVYGHNRCGLSLLIANTLKKNNIEHEWRDILQGDPAWKEELKELARGYLSVPTLVFPDGTVLVEPSPKKVLEKLDIHPKGLIQRLLGG
jgi:mycoredoxin